MTTSAAKNEWVERTKGFVGGTVSGLTKLAIGHPFDTVKVRLQCSPPGTYAGPLECVRSIVRTESVWGVYKGCVPPAIGWMFTDSVLLGSLHLYRRLLQQSTRHHDKLPMGYQGLAGMGAGWTNSIVTAPVELLKTKLQMQKQRLSLHRSAQAASQAEFHGTWDCLRQVVRYTGVSGLWRALPATLWFRTSFGAMFASYDWFQAHLGAWAERHRAGAAPWYAWLLTPASVTFFSGGLAAEVFWFTAYPADVVKNRMMAESLRSPRFAGGVRGMCQVAQDLWTPASQPAYERGVAGLPWRLRRIYTGYLTCALRAFPTNAGALLAFETAMYFMNAHAS
ncbi:L-ornithine transmembrane transporter [Malassezia pachydermatis]|uniref:Mitochondrial carrier n=1 Tax=Malassezia pachydermatis TaxID=77020 RepID=A0A0M8MMY7_9BASI|nr:mitochondrial carrier [Malassezia pachydermatis]KOS14818.1 mitochondrial carrier [Malassezia pachydermatis]